MSRAKILRLYDDLRKQTKQGFYSRETTRLLGEIYQESLSFLQSCGTEELVSKVADKSYFSFVGQRGQLSRAVNSDLFEPDYEEWQKLRAAMDADNLDAIAAEDLQKILYSMAISFCASIDLLTTRDQKTPGTFYEYFVAYFFTWRVGTEPQNSIQILSIDGEDTRLPTDFVFNLGPGKPKFHMPVKTSSRERSIMLWAHQKLLDGVYGVGRFMGTPVLMAETKTDKRKNEVVEICLPDQWRLYQLYIAKLKRVYYLDLPVKYERLNHEFPPLYVRPFSDFFSEWSELVPD